MIGCLFRMKQNGADVELGEYEILCNVSVGISPALPSADPSSYLSSYLFSNMHRIVESPRLEKASKVIQSSCPPTTIISPLNHVEHFQGWGLHHILGTHSSA